MMDPLVESPDEDDEDNEVSQYTEKATRSRGNIPSEEKETLLESDKHAEKEWKRGSRKKKKRSSRSHRSNTGSSESSKSGLTLGSWQIQWGGDTTDDDVINTSHTSNNNSTRNRNSKNKSKPISSQSSESSNNNDAENLVESANDKESGVDDESSDEFIKPYGVELKKSDKRKNKRRKDSGGFTLNSIFGSNANKMIFLLCAIAAYMVYNSPDHESLPEPKSVSSKKDANISEEGGRIREDIMKLGQQMVMLQEKMNNPSVNAEDVDKINGQMVKLQGGIEQQTELLKELQDHMQQQLTQQVQQAPPSAVAPLQADSSAKSPHPMGGGGPGSTGAATVGAQQPQGAGQKTPGSFTINAEGYFPDDKEQKFDAPLDKLRSIDELPMDPTDKVLIWAIPLVGVSTIQGIFDYCFKKVRAAKLRDPPSLELINFNDKLKLVNMDTSDKNTIASAKKEGLINSGLVDFVVTTLFHDGSGLFTDEHNGRAIALLRNPVERSIAMYERVKEQDDDVKEMSLLEYAKSSFFEDNWMCRYLTNNMSDKVTDTHVEMATQILRNKVLIGLADQPVKFMENVARYLDLESMQEELCVSNYLRSDTEMHNKYPSVKQDSDEFKTIAGRNQFDMKLYENARMIFDAQRAMLGFA